jgi:hypothetical protein
MGTKQNPAPFDCYAKALPDEPIFILLARDSAADGAVLHWADTREAAIDNGLKPESDRPMVAEARHWIRTARAWRPANWPARKGEAVRDPRQDLIDVIGHQTERAERAEAAFRALTEIVNRPIVDDFLHGVRLESAHQIQRWGEAHDRSKSAENWFWLVGYLAGKALRSTIEGDTEKAMHHTISSAAALLQWHQAIARNTTNGLGADADLIPSPATAGDGGAGLTATGEGANA